MTNLSFLPCATVNGLTQRGGVSNFSMHPVNKRSKIACCTNSGSFKLDLLFRKKVLGGVVTNDSLNPVLTMSQMAGEEFNCFSQKLKHRDKFPLTETGGASARATHSWHGLEKLTYSPT